jgi:multidrug resistance efflux pump
MVDDSKRQVRAFVEERDVFKVCPGERSRVTAAGVPDVQFDSVVESVAATIGESPYASGASQVRQVLLSVPDSRQQIAIGQRVTVQFASCPPG